MMTIKNKKKDYIKNYEFWKNLLVKRTWFKTNFEPQNSAAGEQSQKSDFESFDENGNIDLEHFSRLLSFYSNSNLTPEKFDWDKKH